ncbi:CatB-related O-acetyltransferase [Spiroplasma culicicola]|uniref:Acetyltransferase n=1 Tax=Spiroplasma culicicola AES-1 TaxID=1276246 RepID=W6A616_9MOLU|nr:CatB-related O-acetyltransferase [Spiroplasma culicicola]AHI52386.1 acetyltransferase [Spiroplasma culicicola AES-1]
MAKSNKVLLLKNYITNKNIKVGNYSYFYGFEGEQSLKEFQNRNVLYHFPEIHDDWLIIGNYCAIAADTKIIMNGANHRINSISTYPFEIFNEFNVQKDKIPAPVNKGNTVIGNDVWIGYGSIIMPGVTIGNGSIIAAGSVIVKDVEPYTIVGGNPAKLIRKRFCKSTIDKIEETKWWDQDIEEVKKLIPWLMSSE